MRTKPIVTLLTAWMFMSIACMRSGTVGSLPAEQSDFQIQTIVAATLAHIESEQTRPGKDTGPAQAEQTSALSAAGTEGPLEETQPTLTSTIPPPTATPQSPPTSAPTHASLQLNNPNDDSPSWFTYFTQSGDTLENIAERFEVQPQEVGSTVRLNTQGLLVPGQALSIPNHVGDTLTGEALLPDSEVVYSPSAADFSVEEYVSSTGGYLSRYDEHVYDERLSGIEIIERVAVESSVSPRLLLAVLEERSGWVFGDVSPEPADTKYPLGLYVSGKKGLYQELAIAATQINKGYYSGRSGIVKELKFKDKTRRRLNPELNAGSMGVQLLYALFTNPEDWQDALYGRDGFLEVYERMFPGGWERAAQAEPLLPTDLVQPEWELPFSEGKRWSLTGGPHYSWNAFSPRGALDFAPVTGELACQVSKRWVTASASGDVVRSAYNVLVIDLDGDGFEGSGWNIVYLHLADGEQTPAGERVETDDRLGHPSCERGHNTGTHVHIARKYNGEWLPADGSVPFVLSGWEVYSEEGNYIGGMTRGSQVVEAKPYGPHASIVVR